jgi:hypothetical protein
MGRAALLAALLSVAAAGRVAAAEARESVLVAEAHGTEPRPLEPRYQPVPPEKEPWYNAGYIFVLTRGVARSTLSPMAKAPLFVLTMPLDVALLPFAALGGLFG